MDVGLFIASAVISRYYVSTTATATKDEKKKRAAPALTLELLKKQNAETSSAIIEHFDNSNSNNSDLFTKLAQYEGDLTVQRDNEDASKLQLGIEFAQQKGVIDPNFVPEPYISIDVLGKTPEEVANLILEESSLLRSNSTTTTTTTTATTTTTPQQHQEGSVIVIVGLSGTGKGTTVSKLRHKLEQQGHVVTTWSNGNIFRSVTLLAATWCQQNCPNGSFDADKACSKENMASFINMLSFDKNPTTGQYDTRITGLGIDDDAAYVSQIQNTTLKSPVVSKNIPTVAQFCQGEVILFAAAAVQRMASQGVVVLLEGREQTVNYVRTPHRFCLHLSDESLIGKRRAAQRLMGQALHEMNENNNDNNEMRMKSVEQILQDALEHLVRDMMAHQKQ